MGQFNIGFVRAFADRVYPSLSFDWIRDRAIGIKTAAQTIGVSAGSVAGIMAEERKDYLNKKVGNEITDRWAQYDFEPGGAEALNALLFGPSLALVQYLASLPNRPARTHAYWVNELAQVNALFPNPDEAPSSLDKLMHPSLIDVGYGNFRIRKAVKLLNDHPEMSTALGLDKYRSDYAALVNDMINPTSDVTAKLYAIYMKEAEDWFKSKNAYNGKWDTLPTEFKDALLVTFVNLGEKKMTELMKTPDAMGYQPSPGLLTAGGMNHLLNISGIGSALGLSGYGDGVVPISDMASLAKASSAEGLAARYALRRLRSVVLPGLDYSPVNTDGQLDLYDAQTGVGALTESWITDRVTMLSWVAKIEKTKDTSLVISSSDEQYFLDYNDAGGVNKVIRTGSSFTGDDSRRHFVFGGAGADTLNGASKSDKLYAGAGADTLNGKNGDDYLEGGAGNDTYQFSDAFGKDIVADTDGMGSLVLDGATLSGGKGAGKRNVWTGKDSAGNYEGYAVYDDARSYTGKRLVITRAGSTDNIITIDHFDLDKATSEGYLGIKLDPTPNLALVQGTGTTVGATTANVWSDNNFDEASLEGKSSTINESVGKLFNIYLSTAAKAGETITLALTDLADKFKAVLGDSTVAANGAVITLAEGQTVVSFALVQEGEVTTEGTSSLSVSYQSTDESAQTATSNSWALNLKDGGEIANTYNGDQRASIIGIETQLDIPADDPRFGTYAWNETSWEKDGTLNGGLEEADFQDVIYASAGNDKLDGKGGNDALGGDAGNDVIEGGAGDDLIGGGSGSDNINGGDGNDYISSNANLKVLLRLKPEDSWTPPAGKFIRTQSATWGIYSDTASSGIIWSGIGNTLTSSPGGDSVDAGAGNDHVMGSWSDDRIKGGLGVDKLDGLAGADILEGGDGNDTILADGLPTQGNLNSVDAAHHGADFADGGADDDILIGGGSDDQLFGGAGDDQMVGDSSGPTNDGFYVTLAYHGRDYLDGEDGNDYLEGGSKDDTLYGGADSDVLWGDSSADFIAQPEHNALMWANDYLDGEDGDDQLVGGGMDDILYGGRDNDSLWGDEPNKLLKKDYQGQDYLDGEDGDDYLEGGGKDDTLYGGEGNDTLEGDSDSATVEGDAHGNDYLDGEDGDDLMAGNGGADTLYGGVGNDQMLGDSYDGDLAAEFQGDDYMDGEEGNDVLLGNNGNDILNGGAGNDQLQGGKGNDQIHGGADDDILFGEEGNDILTGGDGANSFIGGLGDDMLTGSSSDDVYYYSLGDGTDHISDAGGSDWVVFTDISSGQVMVGVGSLKISLPDGGELHLDDFDPESPLDGAIEYFQFSDVVMTRQQLIQTLGFKINGTLGEDDLTGTALGDSIKALAGSDYVNAGGGNDTVDLGEGDDSADAGSGNDEVSGGDGNDSISGREGEDVLDGGAGWDELYGNEGADQLIGGLGDDYLGGGTGNDRLQGDEGNDIYLFGTGDGQDIVIDSIGNNKVLLTGGLTDSQISMSKVGTDLIVSISGKSDRLTVKDWFAASGAGWSLALNDGTVFDRAAVEAQLVQNGVPVLASDTANVIEDAAIQVSGNTLANDADPEGRTLRVTTAGTYASSYGTLTLSSTGAFTYTLDNTNTAVQALAAGQSLSDHFDYTATDDDPAGASSASSSLDITIKGTNDAPMVALDVNHTTEDGEVAATGNVLANDHDLDAGTVLQVNDPGAYRGSYGELAITADGSYVYTLNNNLASVQSLGRHQALSEQFEYTITDGITHVTSSLTIDVGGKNDAPVVAAPLADQSASVNAAYQWQLPAGSFTDIDNGDTLSYSASLADGSALPAWLEFDVLSGIFSGRVPRDAAGYLDIQVTATDQAMDAGTQADDLSTCDTFRLTFEASSGGGGGGGTGSHGNEGVGNGVDGPPPGHDTSINDGTGTSPGNPGAQGGNGRGKIRLIQPQIAAISVAQITDAIKPGTLHIDMSNKSVRNGESDGQSSEDEESARRDGQGGVPVSDGLEATAASNADTTNATETDPTGAGAEVIKLPSFANPALLAHGPGTPAELAGGGASVSYVARWAAMDSELVNHLQSDDTAAAIGSAGPAHGSANGFLGSTMPARQDQLSLHAGSGMGLTTFEGLKEGLRKVA